MTTFDVRQLDSVLQVTSSATSTGQPLLDALAEVLADVSRADCVSVFELDVRGRAVHDIASEVRDGSEDVDDESGMFWDAYPDSVCSWTDPGSPWYGAHPARDVLAPETAYPTWRAFRESRMTRTYGRAVGLGHYVLVPLNSEPGTSRRVLLNRPTDDAPFSDDELTMLRLLQPHVDAAVGRALSGTAAQDALTPRAGHPRVRAGWADHAGHRHDPVGHPRTVRKHLENVYAKLEVPAARKPWHACTATTPPAPAAAVQGTPSVFAVRVDPVEPVSGTSCGTSHHRAEVIPLGIDSDSVLAMCGVARPGGIAHPRERA